MEFPASLADAAAGRPTIERGLALHRAGRVREAAAIYAHLLKATPRHPDLLHLFGLAMHQGGEHGQAEFLIRAAIELSPRSAVFRNNHGMVLKALGRQDDALARFREAVGLDRGYADALANLGVTLPWGGEASEARSALRRACLLAPAHDEAWSGLGSLERVLGNAERADRALRRALAVQPLSAVRRLNLGAALMEADRYDAARAHLARAAILDPALPEPWNHLGYLRLGRLDVERADRSFRRATLLRPGYGAAWAGRAEAAFASGDAASAVAFSRAAVAAEPGNPQLRFRCGIHRLAAGDSGGWADYDALWAKPSSVQRIGAPPRWAGGPLDGRTLLIAADQGVGDELLFSCCVADAVAAGARVVLECDPRLVDLFRRSFPEVFVHAYDRGGNRSRPVQRYGWIPPDWTPDLTIEAGALLGRFRPDAAALDAAARPWLVPDPARVAAMRERLAALGPGPKVGISWRSMRLTEFRNVHYPGLGPFAPMLLVPGARFVCLQYGTGWREELRAADAPVAVIDGLDTTADLEGVAALVAALDVVICPSSTLGWIAAGIGRPNWLLYNTPVFLEFGKDRFPGFPSIRPYRKTQLEPWEPLLRRCADDLAALVARRPDQGPATG